MPVLHVTYSQDLNILVDHFAEECFTASPIFERRLVVVPHLGIKDFLLKALASHPKMQIATGLTVLPLHQAVLEIRSCSDTPSFKKLPSFTELKIAVEDALLGISTQEIVDEKLRSYIEYNRSFPLALSAFAEEIAKGFTEYGLYAEGFLQDWLQKKGWQQDLWRRIFSKWAYPLELFSQWENPHFLGSVFLFGFSHMSAVHLDFFSRLEARGYFFSACNFFWEDMPSDAQKRFLMRKAKKQGVSDLTQEQLHSYLDTAHPLLANWGQLGKLFAQGLDTIALDEKEEYRLPDTSSLLHRLQRSFLAEEEMAFERDDSIQIHSAPNLLREVEVLRDTLQSLLEKSSQEQKTLSFSDIVVVVSDMRGYAPFIEAVLGTSPLEFRLEGAKLFEESSLAFFALLELPSHSFAIEHVLNLLRMSCVQKKWGIKPDEVDLLESWFKKAGIRSSYADHPNSWQAGIDRLLYGLVRTPDEERVIDPWPIPCVSHSEIDLLNRFTSIFFPLCKKLLKLDQEKPFTEWIDSFLSLAEQYVVAEDERPAFLIEMQNLKARCSDLQEGLWSFESISKILKTVAVQSSSSGSLDAILFCSSDRLAIPSARLIWGLGFDEERFPAAQVQTALFEEKCPAPAKRDQDRYLLLEMLMKAEKQLIFSYERVDSKDKQEKRPSLALDELELFLENRGLKEGLIKVDHPLSPLDPLYFSSDAPIKRWSQIDYSTACAYYRPSKKEPLFFDGKGADLPTSTLLQLKRAAQHPLKLFFNEALGVYLQEEEDEQSRDFVFSALEKALFRLESLKSPSFQGVEQLKAQGKLPQARFGDVSIRELQEERELLFERLQSWDVDITEVTQVDLSLQGLPFEGILEGVSEKGFLFHGENKLEALIKAWPVYLLHLHIYPLHVYPRAQQIFFLRDGDKIDLPVEDPALELSNYLAFCKECLLRPCPFLPSFIKAFLEADVTAFKALVEKQEDLYFLFLKRRGVKSDLEPLFDHFQPLITSTFSHLIEGAL